MKKHFIAILFFATALFGLTFLTKKAEAARVKGYYKPSSGAYVRPYYRSSPNSSKWDNYSTQGNYNPYTGKKGYSSPYKTFRFKY